MSMAKKETTELQNKVVRLFTYLEKVLSLDDIIVRDFRATIAAPSPWWLADLPDDVENLYIRKFDNNAVGNDSSLEQNDIWLRVEKKSIDPAPALPDVLTEWIDEISPLEIPKAKEKIARKVRFDQNSVRVMEFKKFRKEFVQESLFKSTVPDVLVDWVVLSPNKLPEAIDERYIEEYFSDHPELASLLKDYIENEWSPWAQKVIKIYKANLLYDQLYALRLLLKNEGDSYELLWGHGLLTWKHKGVGAIYSPIFLTPLTLNFIAEKRVIEISPDSMFKGFVEISSLHEMDNPAEIDLITWADKINASPFNFWHFETLKSQTQFLINTLSTSSEDRFDNKFVSAPDIESVLSVWNAPVIFARKRTNDFWSKYAGIIRRDIEQNCAKPTEFILDLVGDYKEERRTANENGNEKISDIALKESELFFPLPWNDEQKRIAERLDAHYGVVVKGPPGTGKSHTIANLISRFLAQGKTVLVTAQTSKALEVLRDKLPVNIRSLAVSQLHQTAKRDQVLQESITEISSNLGERNTKFSEQNADRLRKDLNRTREEKALLANQIRQYILTDSSAKIEINGEQIKPIDAAKLVSKYKDDREFQWFTDKIHFDTKLNFGDEDLVDFYTLLIELKYDDRGLWEFELPEVKNLPFENEIIEVFSAYKDLSAKARITDNMGNGFKSDFLKILLERVSDAKQLLLSLNENYKQEIFELCILSQNEREKWEIVIEKINQRIQLIGKNNTNILGYEITSNFDMPLEDILGALPILLKKTEKESRVSSLGKLLLPPNAKKILKNYKINGRTPEDRVSLEILHQHILIQEARKQIKLLLEQSFSGVKSLLDWRDLHQDMVRLEVLVSTLQEIVNYHDNFSAIDEFCKKTKQFSNLSFARIRDLETLSDIVSSFVARIELEQVEFLLSEWRTQIESSLNGNRHPIWDKLLNAISKRNITGWKTALDELQPLLQKREKAVRLNELARKISENSQNLCRNISELADRKEKFDPPKNLKLVWKIARLQSWLDHIHDRIDIDDLQSQLGRLTKKEEELNAELITILAWQRQIDKVTKKQRDALMAWSHEMKKYGKGTGKYAFTHLCQAQEALKEARSAVPVWIMPLHRAAQMFSDPKAGMFDVVIFDEASQCDIRGITIGYLGKKLLVVGDPEQISPAGIFQDQEKVFELISRFLFDIPFKDTFSVTSSLFDLAKIRLSNIIQLNEHFRCVPEIIAFSNHHIYEGKLKPLRYPHPKGLLNPPLIPVFIKNGYQNTNNKVNAPEAEAIVEKLVECINDPIYQKRPDGHLCTFGIISLLAEDQAKYIKELILKRLDERIIEERRIACGDAYEFQGDERDVMFLSMVKALDPNNLNDVVRSLTDEGTKRRFNVAASRARDQMFLFHSIPLGEFRNPDDWRYKLLNWFYHPKTEELNAGREILKREFNAGRASQFSFDVGNILIDRGYQIIPEYPVIGYRIDLVVQGDNARLAVECDGDQYHTLENWEDDQIRERQLRRAGQWEFWRVTGSAFYRNKDKSLESLWKRLNDLGINTIHQTTHIPRHGELEGTLKKEASTIQQPSKEKLLNFDIPIQNLTGGNFVASKGNENSIHMDQGSNVEQISYEGIKATINKLLTEGDIQRDFLPAAALKMLDIKVLGMERKRIRNKIFGIISDLKSTGIIQEYVRDNIAWVKKSNEI